MAVRRVRRYWPAAGHSRFLRRTAGPAPRWRRWAQAWHQTPFGRYALQWQVDDGKITVTAAIPPNAAAKICLEPGAKLLETDGLTFAEQNGCPTAQVGSGQYRVSYTMEQ